MKFQRERLLIPPFFPLNLDFWYVDKFISEQKNGYHNILLSGNLLQEGKIGTKEYITPIPNG